MIGSRTDFGASVRTACLLLAALLLAPAAGAQDYSAARKFGRGLAGITVGFLEIPGNVVEESRESGALSGMTVGLAMGLGKFVTRTLVGVYEVLSAPFELPAGFEPILEPEFAWQYFDDDRASASRASTDLAADLSQLPGVLVATRGDALVVTLGEDLLFRIGSATLAPGAPARLAELAALLSARPELLVQVLGHTDTSGSAPLNLRLSTARAEAVASELTSRGVDPHRVSVLGLGAADPIADNATAAGRQLNRRVEIELR